MYSSAMMWPNAGLPGPLAGGPGGGQRRDRVGAGLRGQVGAHLGDHPGLRGRGVVGEPEPQVVEAADAAQGFHGGLGGVEDRRGRAVRAGGRGQVHPGAADPQRHQRAAGGPHVDRAAVGDGVVGGPAVARVGQDLARPGHPAGEQRDGVDRGGRQVGAGDLDVLGAGGRCRRGGVAQDRADRGDARQVAERAELGRGQVKDAGGHPDVVQVALLDLAVHRRVQQARHGEETQARDGDAQREHGQQRAGAVPGQVTPGLAVQRAHWPAAPCRRRSGRRGRTRSGTPARREPGRG